MLKGWLIGITLVLAGFCVWQIDTHTAKFDFAASSEKYHYSQYCLRGYRDQFHIDELFPEYSQLCGDGSEFRGNIDDPELYQLAGSSYIHGASPTAINWELQPLGKYLIGLSILLTGNTILMQLSVAILLLILLYQTGRGGGLGKYWALVPVLLLVSDRLFQNQLRLPYLDLLQSCLILFFLYLLARGKLRYALCVLGLVALSKSFATGMVLWGVGGIFLLTVQRANCVTYLKASLVSVVIYLLGYTRFFLDHSLLDFGNLHLATLKFYHAYVPEYPRGEIWRILFFGKWRTWWGEKGLVPVPEFTFAWPLCALSVCYYFIQRKMRDNPLLLIHVMWVIIYLLFLSLRLVFPRYLLVVLPSLYLILTGVLVQISHLCNIVSNDLRYGSHESRE